MDETGQSSSGPADRANGAAGHRHGHDSGHAGDRTEPARVRSPGVPVGPPGAGEVNGWHAATAAYGNTTYGNGTNGNGWQPPRQDTTWTSAGAALEPEPDPVPQVRRDSSPPSWNGTVPASLRGNTDGIRYSDLLAPLRPPVSAVPSASAPPYPYEGDLEDARQLRDPWAPPEPVQPGPTQAAPGPAGPIPPVPARPPAQQEPPTPVPSAWGRDTAASEPAFPEDRDQASRGDVRFPADQAARRDATAYPVAATREEPADLETPAPPGVTAPASGPGSPAGVPPSYDPYATDPYRTPAAPDSTFDDLPALAATTAARGSHALADPDTLAPTSGARPATAGTAAAGVLAASAGAAEAEVDALAADRAAVQAAYSAAVAGPSPGDAVPEPDDGTEPFGAGPGTGGHTPSGRHDGPGRPDGPHDIGSGPERDDGWPGPDPAPGTHRAGTDLPGTAHAGSGPGGGRTSDDQDDRVTDPVGGGVGELLDGLSVGLVDAAGTAPVSGGAHQIGTAEQVRPESGPAGTAATGADPVEPRHTGADAGTGPRYADPVAAGGPPWGAAPGTGGADGDVPRATGGSRPGRPDDTRGWVDPLEGPIGWTQSPADPPLGPPTPIGQPSLADYPSSGSPYPGADPPASSPLPQRIPAPPDVPDVPDDEVGAGYPGPDRDPASLAPPELARIATRLRDDEGFVSQPAPPEELDVNAVLAAVREVDGVRDAKLVANPGGVHTLRLDLADGADPGQVSRLVARLLKQRMGLAAEPRRPAAEGDAAGPGAATARGDVPAARRQAPTSPPDPLDTGGSGGRGAARWAETGGAAPAPRTPVSSLDPVSTPLGASDDRARRHPVPPPRGRVSPEGRSDPGSAPERIRPVGASAGSRVVLDQVQVSTLGLDASVEVRLTNAGRPAIGVASGPAVDGYVLRLAAVAAAAAVDQLLSTVDSWGDQPGRCFVENAAVVPFGSCEVAVVVVLLVCNGVAEQLSGSAVVAGDPRQAVVRAALAAVNRRLDALLG